MQASETSRRRKALRDLVLGQPVRTQRELANALRQQGFSATQSTVSRDLKALRIRDVGGTYALSAHRTLSPEQSRLALELSRKTKLPKAAPGIVALPVTRDYEQLACKLVTEAYDDLVIGTVSGNGIILIITEDEDTAGQLEKMLKDLPNIEDL